MRSRSSFETESSSWRSLSSSSSSMRKPWNASRAWRLERTHSSAFVEDGILR